MANDDQQPAQQQIQITNANLFVPYCDFAMLRSNPDGLVMDFLQAMGPGGQFQIVSRVGMSVEHAKKLLAALQQHLAGITGAAPQAQQTSTATQQVGFSVEGAR